MEHKKIREWWQVINYEMALSEIEMYKKAHESLSENLTHANKRTQQFKAERDTLIDDLSWYKAKVSRLKRENKDLRLQSDTYFEQWQQHKALNNEISQHIGHKPSSSTYKYFRAKLDGLNIKEGE